MSGSDTSRGINFQYATAISVLLELIENVVWDSVQLEGDEDIEDILVFDKDNCVIERIQIKQKRDPYQWKPSEFRDIILDFAKLNDSETVQYRVIYSGSEGSDFYNKLKPILFKIQIDGWKSLSKSEIDRLLKLFDSQAACEFIEKTQQRFSIEKHDSWTSKKIKDLEKIRAILTSARLGNNIETDINVYSALFEKIAANSEGENNYSRLITKSELYAMLGIENLINQESQLNHADYHRWIQNSASLYTNSALLFVQEESSYPDILNLVINVQSESDGISTHKQFSLSNVIERFPQVLLFGESGSGKTVSLWQIALNAIKDDGSGKNHLVPIYVDLSSYDGEQIGELIQSSIASSGQQLSGELIDGLSKEGELFLLFDDYDYCRSNLRQELHLRLKGWLGKNNKNKVVVVSHSPSDGANLDLHTFKIVPLSTEQSSEILSGIVGIDKRDIANIQYGLPLESKYFLSNPLLLKMFAYYYLHSDRSIPKSRSPLYQSVVDGILSLSEQKGYSEFSKDIKIRLLALIATWMQNNGIYSISPSIISNLLLEWSNENSIVSPRLLNDLSHYRLIIELLHSGIFQFQLNGNIQFIHSTFRSFLATYTIAEESIKELIANDNWYSSVLFWASQVDLRKSDVVFDYLSENLILLGQIIDERAAKRTKVDLNSVDCIEYFGKFCDHFVGLARKFPLLLSYNPWDRLLNSGLNLFVCRFGNDNSLVYFRPSHTKESSVKGVDFVEIEKLQKDEPKTVPLTLCLIPNRIITTYHPLELSYILILRFLFDSLYFFGREGGADVSKVNLKILPHPAFGLILNSFVLFQELCLKLPSVFKNKLPFYATQPFSIIIELHAYTETPFVRYAIIEKMRPKAVSVIPLMYSNAKDVKHLIKHNQDGTSEVTFEKRTFISIFAKDVHLGDLFTRSPGSVAQSWLRDFLKENLVGFPPREW